MNLDEFLSQAANHGPCVSLHAASPQTLQVPPGVEVRIIDRSDTTTLNGVFEAFAAAWHFPQPFTHNRDAFNDWMRDLDNLINTASGKPPAPGYLTNVINAHLILAEQPEFFAWFAEAMPFYRDYYCDEASPPATFALLLAAPVGQLDHVRARWAGAGVQVARISI